MGSGVGFAEVLHRKPCRESLERLDTRLQIEGFEAWDGFRHQKEIHVDFCVVVRFPCVVTSMESFERYLDLYGRKLFTTFRPTGLGLKFNGVSFLGKIPEQRPLSPDGCWGISYSATRVVCGVECPWAVWVWYQTAQGTWERDVALLEPGDLPHVVARAFLERLAVRMGKNLASSEVSEGTG